MAIYLDCKAQMALLKTKEAPISVSAKYSDFTDVFSKKLSAMLPEYTKINTHIINLEKGKQLPYRPIYNLDLVEPEILKTYIKTNLV